MKVFLHQINRHICEILIVLLAIFFFSTKNVSEPYDQVIMAEGLGYYAYLPATYIYHDLSFDFFNDIHSTYYATAYSPPTKNFVIEFDGLRLNKYFPGVSFLWLPFFLVAHLLALLFHLPADGYSPVYQYAIGFAGLFYTYLGLLFTKRILTAHRILPFIQVVTLTGILFATNMLLYSASWSAQTHVYSFFLIAAFCWYAMKLFDPEFPEKGFALGVIFVLLAFLFTTRPQDIIILLLLPFLGFRIRLLPDLIRKYLFSFLSLAGLIIAGLLIARVCYYWYIQTGKMLLQPYHGEHYILSKPHVVDILCSYRKGWLLYSPFITFGLAGILFVKGVSSRLNLFLFWSLLIYLSSCWWCWTYSPSSFGQRPFIDYYSLIALQAAYFFQFLHQKKWTQIAPAALLVCVPLNLLQTHQYRKGILPGEFGSAETYWSNFFSVRPVAYYPLPRKTILSKEEVLNSFDRPEDNSIPQRNTYSPGGSSYVCRTHTFSDNIKAGIPAFLVPGLYSHVRISAMIKSSPTQADHESIVVDFKRNDSTVSYHGFGLGSFVFDRNWKKIQFGLELPAEVKSTDSVLVYLWRSESANSDTTYLDDLIVEFILTDDSFDFKRSEK